MPWEQFPPLSSPGLHISNPSHSRLEGVPHYTGHLILTQSPIPLGSYLLRYTLGLF